MSNAYAQIAYTPDVREEQRRFGSADAYVRVLSPERQGGAVLTAREAEFLTARDGFFQATTSETGWPYVPFRGGAPGFLKVIDVRTIGYSDYRGNRQYISLGNLRHDDRISLIAVDYVRQKRLKLLGHAMITEDPDVIGLLWINDGPKAERGIVIHVDACDWNWPLHIPIHLTDAEWDHEIGRLNAHIKQLQNRLKDTAANKKADALQE